MIAIAGLGNPGLRYARTRHNAGFETVDLLSAMLRIPVSRSRFHALVGEGSYQGVRLVLLKPQTYMNLSGQSIAEAMRWYKIEPQHMLIISDDIDLPPGVIRLRSKGGAGTHNGWKSILQETGTDLFPRIRIGTGAPPPQWDLADWVLTGYSEENRQVMENAFALAAEAALCFAEHGIDLAMNRYNKRNHEESTV
ncbi:MAG: aminoacyl-tRNA hydrolase [Christensenellales bacterium]|jgi:PTH1 family peptidyl-tRNA hydrolase